MGRGKRDIDRRQSERRCLVSGASCSKSDLIRFVIGPDGDVVPDLLQKLPGRGFWVSADRAMLTEAAKGKAFARAARQSVKLAPDLVDMLEEALACRTTALIALARKAGEAVAGYEKTKAWLTDGTAAILVQASNGSERGKSKLRPPDGPDTLINVLTGSELGTAFGRENVIHGALAAGGLTNRVVEEAARLAGLRPASGANAPDVKE